MVETNSGGQGKQPTGSSAGTRPQSSWSGSRLLVLVAIVYGIWLAWLAYVAWVNVQAGNQ